MEPNVKYELIDADLPSTRRMERLAVWCTAALALVLGVLRMALQAGAGDMDAVNTAAAMAMGWRNALLGMVDAAGTTTAGPAAALWPQAGLAALLGASPFSVRLPQAIAALLCCLLAASAMGAGRGSSFGRLAFPVVLVFSPAFLALNGDADGMLWAAVCLLAAAALALSAVWRCNAGLLVLSAVLGGLAFHMVGWAALTLWAAVAALWFLDENTRPRLVAFVAATAVYAMVGLAWYGYLAALEPAVRPQIIGAVGNDPFWLLLEHRSDGVPDALSRLIGSAWGAVNVWWLPWGGVAGVAGLAAALTQTDRDRWPALVQGFWLSWAVAAAAWLAFAPQPLPVHGLALALALGGLCAHSAMVLLDGLDRPWVALAAAAALFAAGAAQTRWLGALAVWGRWAFVFPLAACAAALVLGVLRLLPASQPRQWRAVAVVGLVALLAAPVVFALGALLGSPGNPVAQVMSAVR